MCRSRNSFLPSSAAVSWDTRYLSPRPPWQVLFLGVTSLRQSGSELDRMLCRTYKRRSLTIWDYSFIAGFGAENSVSCNRPTVGIPFEHCDGKPTYTELTHATPTRLNS